ncbi:MAG TPA: glycosyltransferase family 4 protein [Cellvibrionaceae bacterium]
MKNTLYFLVPGDIRTHSGGYAYNRRIIKRLIENNVQVILIELSALFPFPDRAAMADADAKLTGIPAHEIVLVDGLALGAMPQLAQKHAARLYLLALCHHPLAMETGLSSDQVDYFQRAEQQALFAARSVLVTSNTTANYLTQFYAVPNSKIKIALPGTQPHGFAARRGAPPILLTVASVIPRKGHDLLLQALERIEDIAWRARWVGNTQLNPGWSAWIHQQLNVSKVADRIAWLEDIVDTTEEYLAADFFVLPSAYEGYGMAFAEALSSGLPIIAFETGAQAQWLPQQTCLLVPPGDVNALAEALRVLLLNSPRSEDMAAAARIAAQSLPSWENAAEIVHMWLNEFFSLPK